MEQWGMLGPFNTDKDFLCSVVCEVPSLGLCYSPTPTFPSLETMNRRTCERAGFPSLWKPWLSQLRLNYICSSLQGLAEMCHFLSTDCFSGLTQLCQALHRFTATQPTKSPFSSGFLVAASSPVAALPTWNHRRKPPRAGRAAQASTFCKGLNEVRKGNPVCDGRNRGFMVCMSRLPARHAEKHVGSCFSSTTGEKLWERRRWGQSRSPPFAIDRPQPAPQGWGQFPHQLETISSSSPGEIKTGQGGNQHWLFCNYDHGGLCLSPLQHLPELQGQPHTKPQRGPGGEAAQLEAEQEQRHQPLPRGVPHPRALWLPGRLPTGPAPGPALAGEPRADAAATLGQHQGGGRAGEPAGRRRRAVLAGAVHAARRLPRYPCRPPCARAPCPLLARAGPPSPLHVAQVCWTPGEGRWLWNEAWGAEGGGGGEQRAAGGSGRGCFAERGGSRDATGGGSGSPQTPGCLPGAQFGDKWGLKRGWDLPQPMLGKEGCVGGRAVKQVGEKPALEEQKVWWSPPWLLLQQWSLLKAGGVTRELGWAFLRCWGLLSELSLCSFWSRSTAISTVKTARPDGRVLTCGAFLEATR